MATTKAGKASKATTKGKSSGRGRTRNYATVVYPESADKNWKENLVQQFVPAFVSPLHDEDENPTGEKKKPHYHVLIMFDGVKTRDQAKAVIEAFGGVGCEVVNSLRGYARYLCHLDNPDKFQYDKSKVASYCGADYDAVIGLTTDKYVAIGEMIDYCVENDIVSYADLLIHSRNCEYGWFRVLCDNGTVVMKEFLKSQSWTKKEKAVKDFYERFEKLGKPKDIESFEKKFDI